MVGRLTALTASRAGPGIYPDGDGLYLCVSKTGRRTWVFRFSWQGRRPEMGLGNFDDLPLIDARDAAAAARKLVRAGINPIEARRAERIERQSRRLFGDVADELIAAKSHEWRNEKHREQWRISLEKAAAPLRALPVDMIETEHVLSVLAPIWTETPESAARLRQRIEAVLSAARAKGLRAGDNPAAWRGHLEHLLPKRPGVARGHHAALDYREAPAFMRRLRELDTVAARALEFTILTAARSGETYGATWPEIDAKQAVWIIPATRMKAGRAHRVPLSEPARDILATLSTRRVSDFVFPGMKRGKPLSHVAMAKVIERLSVENATPHGFRSCFRDWCGNETNHPREIAEAALAHTIGDAAEQAYRRGDALEKRRVLMNDWAAYLRGD